MQKKILLFAITLFSLTSLLAQTVTESKQEFMKKTTGNAMTITLKGQQKNVMTVLDQKVRAATQNKPKSKSGFHYLEGVVFPQISSSRLDYYYQVERASKKATSESRVTFFISAGNNNFLTSEGYREEMGNLKDMLEALPLEVKIYEMGLLIQEQTKVVGKEEKNHDRMIQDSVKLEIELAETIQSIEQNKLDRKNQIQLIEQEKDRLATFKAQLSELKQKQSGKGDEALIEEVEELIEDDGGDR